MSRGEDGKRELEQKLEEERRAFESDKTRQVESFIKASGKIISSFNNTYPLSTKFCNIKPLTQIILQRSWLIQLGWLIHNH